MLKVVEFRNKNFWSSTLDINKLNETINGYEQSGWTIRQIDPVTTFLGVVIAYVLVLEMS